MDDDLAPVDDADPADDAGAGNIAAIGLVGGKRRELEKWRAGIEQQFDAVAHEHLVLAFQPFDVARRPVAPRGMLTFAQGRGQAAIVRGIEAEFFRTGVEAAVDAAHAQAPACGASLTRGAARSKVLPTATWMVAMTPSRGALMAVSSFMLSITTSVSPRATVWPSAAWTAMTTPGIGASIKSSDAPAPWRACRATGSVYWTV